MRIVRVTDIKFISVYTKTPAVAREVTKEDALMILQFLLQY